MNTSCDCKSIYSIDIDEYYNYVLYYDRCKHRHGYNLAKFEDVSFNFEPKHLESLLNLGDTVYKQNPLKEYIAE